MMNKADCEAYPGRIACLCHDMESKAVDEVVDSVGNLIRLEDAQVKSSAMTVSCDDAGDVRPSEDFCTMQQNDVVGRDD
jgi:hypothetical protein